MPQRAKVSALLVLQIGDLFRLAEAQRVLAALQEARREQAGDIASPTGP